MDIVTVLMVILRGCGWGFGYRSVITLEQSSFGCKSSSKHKSVSMSLSIEQLQAIYYNRFLGSRFYLLMTSYWFSGLGKSC